MSSYRSRRRKPMSEINVVPYIDVMLVLLVIFMITTPLLTEGVDVELPQASARDVEQKDTEPFVVNITADGKYFVNEEEESPATLDDIVTKAAAMLRIDETNHTKTDFMVRGDKGVDYGTVVQAMAALQQAGVPSVGLLTQSPE
ncbi:MAG: protein TolR [Gammaproteobacteria bacterium]|nr:MAG: protein TolR [Gammaproteobacteria bacterium]RTZ60608.1 MAG: protein TolR [Gammaproteobacteria bacterium]